MKILGQLESAQGENRTSDPTGTGLVAGRIWFRTDLSLIKFYDGATVRSVPDTTTAQTLQNKTLDNTNTVTLLDTLFTIQDNSDPTKQAKFEASAIGAGTTRTFTLPNANTTIVGIDTTQVITEKDIDGGTASNARRITLPKETTTNLDALTDKEGTVAYDTTQGLPVYNNGSVWAPISPAGGYSAPNTLANLGLDLSVAASALTIALKQLDGTTNPASGAGAVRIAFRDATNANGGTTIGSVTGALSTVISSGSTAGHTSAKEEWLFIYALLNAGTVELAWSSSLFDCNVVQSTTAEGGAGAADSAAVLYSTTARTNVPIALIGKARSTQATAGTWATDPAVVTTQECPRYTFGSLQTFSADGTWTKPSGCKAVLVKVIGAGGGGGGADGGGGTGASAGGGGGGGGYSEKFITVGLGATETVTVGTGGTAGTASGGGTGGTGSTSSFGAHCSATGANGSGGDAAPSTSDARSQTTGGTGGTGSGGAINATGQTGFVGITFGVVALALSGGGGMAAVMSGKPGQTSGGNTAGDSGSFGAGGAGGSVEASTTDRAGGTGGDGRVFVYEYY